MKLSRSISENRKSTYGIEDLSPAVESWKGRDKPLIMNKR